MSEQVSLASILAILGVAIGWALSQLTDLAKIRQRRNTAKKALVSELSIIRKTLSDALAMKTHEAAPRIPHDQFPLIVETYDSVKVELASFLKPHCLTAVQRTYEEIRKMNSDGGGIVFAGSQNHLYQFTDFDKIIALIDESVNCLK